MSYFNFHESICLHTFFEGQVAQKRLEQLLAELDKCYTPQLSCLVNIHEYSIKIANQGCVIYAHNTQTMRDIGLVAFYANSLSKDYSFITSIGVANDYHGHGVADALLQNSIEICSQRGFQFICLEVSRNNSRAISFYLKYGFIEDATKATSETLYMKKLVNYSGAGKL